MATAKKKAPAKAKAKAKTKTKARKATTKKPVKANLFSAN